MIKVKAFKDVETRNKPSREDYVVEEKQPRHVWPLAFLLAVSGFLIYLKSFLPGVEAAADRAQKEPENGEQAPASDNALRAEEGAEEEVTNSTGDEAIGSSNVVPISFARPSGGFMASDVEPIDFSRLDRNTVVNLHPAARDSVPPTLSRGADRNAGDGEGKGAGGGGGGGGASDTPEGFGSDRDWTEGPHDADPQRNRAPRSNGPVRLQDVVGCQTLFISSAALLAETTDADGDPLTILALSATSGTLVAVEGGWEFTPADDMRGNVVLSYYIGDGEVAVMQFARFSVVDAPPIIGTDGDDHLIGTNCGEFIDGRGGCDTIDARGGDDLIHGGAGNDCILAGSGNDTVHAGAGDDTVYGGKGNDRLFGEAGNDTILGETGSDYISGGEGYDSLSGGTGNDVIFGDAGADLIDGGDGADELDGGDGRDTIYGGAGADKISAGADDDVAFGGSGGDQMSGGVGNDTLLGEDGNDQLDGGAGRDVLIGGSGADTVAGDADDDVIEGNDGNDVLLGGDGHDVILAGAGDDIGVGDAGNDHLAGGAGNDTLVGGDGDDELDGGDGVDALSGGDGNDTILDGMGADVVSGGSGDDCVVAAADGASDLYNGGDGDDTIDYSSAILNVTIDLGRGRASGEDIGEDLIESFGKVIAGAGDDKLVAGDGSVRMTGGQGKDKFEFQVSNGDHQPEHVRQITDFSIGDRLIVASYEIRYREGEDASAAIEDLFENVYLSGDGNRPVRFRFEQLDDDDDRTFVDVFHNNSDEAFSIELFGRHSDLEFTVSVSQGLP